MKESIRSETERFVPEYAKAQRPGTAWGIPLVGFASASDPLFDSLKTAISPTVAMPNDLLADAATVIVIFLPFTKALSKTNADGRHTSQEWAVAYIETNRLIEALCLHLKGFLEERGHSVHPMPATHNFDEQKLISDWSHRHIAYIAGLGKFGLNNMLITRAGCCGRLGSLITSLALEPDPRPETESCLFRYDGSCGKCAKRCVADALRADTFHRHDCYDICLENDVKFASLATTDVCGKCMVRVPCAHKDPVQQLGTRK